MLILFARIYTRRLKVVDKLFLEKRGLVTARPGQDPDELGAAGAG